MEINVSGEPEVVVLVSGGVVTEVLSTSPLNVQVIDFDNIKVTGEVPDVPKGITYHEDGHIDADESWLWVW